MKRVADTWTVQVPVRPARSISAWPSGVSYSANKNPGQWKAHGTYVARESATQGGRAAEAGFNATKQNLGIATTLDNWQSAGDDRLFKIIVSPEFADRLNLQQ